MSPIVIVDTNVLLNVLNVPSYNQDRKKVIEEFEELINSRASLLLPMAAIFETGNHIADLPNGSQRRKYAKVFRDQVRKALRGEAPWVPIRFPDSQQLAEWLEDFPDYSMRGQDMSDLSILKVWEFECLRHPYRRVYVWSLAQDMLGFDRIP